MFGTHYVLVRVLKGKLVNAMQNGTPAIMSTIAAEGMLGNLDANGFITDNPKEFAHKSVELYTTKTIWKTYQNNGFKILKERFDISNFERNFTTKIESLKQNIQQHRQDNFIGQLLMHHTIQSTKYLSKWIEEKNSLR